MEGVKIRVEESRQTSHSPVGKFDKNHFGSASQQVFVLKPGTEIEARVGLEELELEELAFGNLRVLLSFMVTFAIIIIMCRVQWQQHFLACLAGSSGNWGLASLLWPHLTVTVVLHSLPFSLPPVATSASQLRWLCKYKNLEQNVRNFMSFQFANCPQQIGPGSATHVCHEFFLIVISICLFFPHTLPLLCLSLSLSHSFWQRQCDNDVWQKGEWVKSFCQLKYEYLIGLLMQTLTHTHTRTMARHTAN